MDNISILGIILSVVIVSLFIIEFLLLIKTLKLKQKNRIGLHVLGVVSTLLVSIFTVTSTLKIKFQSSNMAMATFILASIFFIYLGVDTLIIEKKFK